MCNHRETKSSYITRSFYIPLALSQETEEVAFMLDSSVSCIVTKALEAYLQTIVIDDMPTEFPDPPIDAIMKL